MSQAEPLSLEARADNYAAQTGPRTPTPAQRRRTIKKARHLLRKLLESK